METINAKGKMKNAKWKILIFAICTLQFAIVLSGCVAMQVIGEIQNGRRELMYGDPKAALAHFQRAAELDPDYLLNLAILPEGVWTYMGRAYYATGNLPEARKALERARSRYEQDNLAKLYLGLVLARDGDQGRGLKEIEAGLKGLHEWLNYIERYHYEGRFWDNDSHLRSAIQKTLATIKGGDTVGAELIASGERLGRGFEEEITEVKKLMDLEIRINDGGGKGD